MGSPWEIGTRSKDEGGLPLRIRGHACREMARGILVSDATGHRRVKRRVPVPAGTLLAHYFGEWYSYHEIRCAITWDSRVHGVRFAYRTNALRRADAAPRAYQ